MLASFSAPHHFMPAGTGGAKGAPSGASSCDIAGFTSRSESAGRDALLSTQYAEEPWPIALSSRRGATDRRICTVPVDGSFAIAAAAEAIGHRAAQAPSRARGHDGPCPAFALGGRFGDLDVMGERIGDHCQTPSCPLVRNGRYLARRPFAWIDAAAAMSPGQGRV